MQGKQVISADEAVGKIKAAVDARVDPDVVLIARTDVLAVEGAQSATGRVLRYSEAGADVLWVEAPTLAEELADIVRQLKGKMVPLNWLEGGRTPMIDAAKIKATGFAVVLYPIGSVLTVEAALREHYAAVRRDGTPLGRMDKLPSFEDFATSFGLKEIEAFEKNHASEAQS